jgi:hypothetical protein
MDPAAPVGTAMMAAVSRAARGLATTLLFVSIAPAAAAADHYAIVVTGATGDAAYVQRFDEWRDRFASILRDAYGYDDEHLFVLAERPSTGVRDATAAQIRATLAQVQRRAVEGDVILILLMGHGSVFEGDDARFNLVGPDLTMDEWASLVKPIAGRLVFVNATAGSFPFLRMMAGKNRVVLTATDTIAQRYVTVFPEFFVRAFNDEGADLNKDNRVSIWEAFEYASAGVKRWFEEKGQPATERALIDDTGEGIGREAGTQGPDGPVAEATYLRTE